MFRNELRADNDGTDESNSTDELDNTAESILTDRRTYLKAAGAAASVPLLVSEGAAAEHRGISFDSVVNMVDDAGCDPNGDEPCDSKLKEAAESNTLLKFPAGEYKFTEKNTVLNATNLGFLGDGDVRFTVPEGFNENLLLADRGTGLLFENIDIDQRADGATPGLHLGTADNLHVQDVEFIGQGIHPDSKPRSEDSGNPAVTNALTPVVRSSNGAGVVKNVVADNAGLMGAYNDGDGRVGVWVGMNTKGTITLENCQFDGFPNNGLYCSRTPGVVKVEGGTFRNNDVSQVRIGSSGSYVNGATIETDTSKSNSPNPGEMLNGSGIRLEKPKDGSGAAIRDCDVRIGPAVTAGSSIQIFSNYGTFTIENTRIECNPDETYAILAQSPDQSEDTSGMLRNVSVTGDAADFIGVLIEDRPDTVVENCCIHQTSNGRVGLALNSCDDSRVANSTINAGAQALRLRDTSAEITGIDESGTCPAPNLASDDGSSSDSSSGGSSSSSSDGDSSGGTSSALAVTDDSADGRSQYEITASGGMEKTAIDGATRDDNDDISENTASGGVNGWRDSYEYDGELLAFEVSDHGATIKLDASEGTITVLGTESGDTSYSLEVSGSLEHAGDSGDPISDDGSSVEGGVGTFRDVYNYTGGVMEASIEDGVTLTTSPESG